MIAPALLILTAALPAALAQPAVEPSLAPDPPTDAAADPTSEPTTQPRELAPEERPDAETVETPDLRPSPAVRARIDAEFLTDEERADLRILHGRWTPADLADPARRARALVMTHAWDDPFLTDPAAPATDRATALLNLGRPAEALDALAEQSTPRAERIRGRALELLARPADAVAAYERAMNATTDEPESVRAALALTRLKTPTDSEGFNRALLARIARARDADRLNFDARLAEAELLYARHNLPEASNAAKEALTLNPRSAAAWRLLGDIAVDAFDFDTSESIADRLDALAPGDGARPSADGAALRARAALRRRDPQDAIDALAPAIAAMPERHELLAIRAAAESATFDTDATEALLAEFDRRSPALPDALVWVGRTLAEARQYDLADAYLQRAIERAPAWALPRLERGLMLVQAGDDAAARAELEQALARDPFDLRAQNSLTLVTELATYQTIETDHFVIRFKPGIDAALAPEMAVAMEALHARVCSDAPGGVDFEPARKTTIELMPNHEWFAVRIGGMPSIHTMAASTGPIIAIESPQEGPKFTVGPFDWKRVLQHEYTHTVNLARTRNRIIHWLTEANAVFNEDSPRDMRTWRLLASAYTNNELFDLEQINIAFVRPKRPQDRSLAYAQGAWMFEYIVERWGPDAPRAIMDASTAGASAVEAFEQVLAESPQSFLEAFTPWARDQLLERGLILPDDLPPADELLAGFMGGPDDPDATPPEQLIDELLAEYPDHPELLDLKLAFALMRADERLSDEQIALLERMIAVRPPDDAPHRRLARHYLAAESFDERLRAIPHLEFLDAREIHTPAYAAALADLYAKSGNPTGAQEKAERAASIAPFDADQREQAARMALLNNDLDAAERHLTALAIIEPDRDIHRRRLDALNKLRASR